jgi:hypothetical protein
MFSPLARGTARTANSQKRTCWLAVSSWPFEVLRWRAQAFRVPRLPSSHQLFLRSLPSYRESCFFARIFLSPLTSHGLALVAAPLRCVLLRLFPCFPLFGYLAFSGKNTNANGPGPTLRKGHFLSSAVAPVAWLVPGRLRHKTEKVCLRARLSVLWAACCSVWSSVAMFKAARSSKNCGYLLLNGCRCSQAHKTLAASKCQTVGT